MASLTKFGAEILLKALFLGAWPNGVAADGSDYTADEDLTRGSDGFDPLEPTGDPADSRRWTNLAADGAAEGVLGLLEDGTVIGADPPVVLPAYEMTAGEYASYTRQKLVGVVGSDSSAYFTNPTVTIAWTAGEAWGTPTHYCIFDSKVATEGRGVLIHEFPATVDVSMGKTITIPVNGALAHFLESPRQLSLGVRRFMMNVFFGSQVAAPFGPSSDGDDGLYPLATVSTGGPPPPPFCVKSGSKRMFEVHLCDSNGNEIDTDWYSPANLELGELENVNNPAGTVGAQGVDFEWDAVSNRIVNANTITFPMATSVTSVRYLVLAYRVCYVTGSGMKYWSNIPGFSAPDGTDTSLPVTPFQNDVGTLVAVFDIGLLGGVPRVLQINDVLTIAAGDFTISWT